MILKYGHTMDQENSSSGSWVSMFFAYLTKIDRSGVTPSAHTYTGFKIEIKRNQLVLL